MSVAVDVENGYWAERVSARSSWPVLLRIADGSGKWRSETAVRMEEPIRLWPSVMYDTGSLLKVEASLPDGVNIGRKHLRVVVIVHGQKVDVQFPSLP